VEFAIQFCPHFFELMAIYKALIYHHHCRHRQHHS